MDICAEALDVAGVAERVHDLAAGVGRVAVVAAVLGDDDAAVVVKADQVAGSHCGWGLVDCEKSSFPLFLIRGRGG